MRIDTAVGAVGLVVLLCAGVAAPLAEAQTGVAGAGQVVLDTAGCWRLHHAMNGMEVAEGKGVQTLLVLSAYGVDRCWTAAMGKPTPEVAKRINSRVRKLSVAVPSKALRQGMNVLAIEIVRAPCNKVVEDQMGSSDSDLKGEAGSIPASQIRTRWANTGHYTRKPEFLEGVGRFGYQSSYFSSHFGELESLHGWGSPDLHALA